MESLLRDIATGTLTVSRTVCLLEWPDLDPRLGLRSEIALSRQVLDSCLQVATAAATRIGNLLGQLGDQAVLVPPTLVMPPLFPTRSTHLGRWQASLQALVSTLVERALNAGVVVLDRDSLATAPRARSSARNDVRFGHPFSDAHARDVAGLVAELLVPPPRKKGLILDLDNTLWRGIVGDDGAENVAWSLEQAALQHGVLQRFVSLLADAGILVGVVTKNEADVASTALARADLIISRESLWPVIASWDNKSSGVRRIAAAWNVLPESLVMLDDSPLELAEIRSEIPEIMTLHFDPDDMEAVIDVLRALQDYFGALAFHEEDSLRASSMRAGVIMEEAEHSDERRYDEFLASLSATMRVEGVNETSKGRVVELVNKTNQFNINGARVGAGAEKSFFSGGDVLVVSYEDRLSKLGVISVIRLVEDETSLTVTHWVLSCRAFARRIEHSILKLLAERAGGRELRVTFAPTEKNMPVARFLHSVTGEACIGDVVIDATMIAAWIPEVRPTTSFGESEA
jgi:FkbH-like protein